VTDGRRHDEAPEGHPEAHPEDLLHRARAGQFLSPRERLQRKEHLRTCDVCRLLEETRAELLDEAARPPSGKSITELVAATMAAFQAPSAQGPPAPPTGRRGSARHPARMAAVAAAVVCAVTGVALAARWIVEARTAPRAPDQVSSDQATPPRRVGHPTGPLAAAAAPSDGDASGTQPAPAGATGAPAAASPGGGAAALFARATAARRAGRVDEARRAYQQLGRDFPATIEAQTGQVAYGRWLLDRDEAQPAAVVFDDYLRANPRGTLAAEAAVGRAEALERLGDRPGARRAWEDVLVNPAAGAFGRHARARLRALEGRARDVLPP